VPPPWDIWNGFTALLYPDMADPTNQMLFGDASFSVHFLQTLWRMYAGFLLGSFVGIVAGKRAARSRLFRTAFEKLIKRLATTPRLFMLCVMVTGIFPFGPVVGSSAVVALASIVSFIFAGSAAFSLAANKDYDDHRNAAKSDGATALQIFFLIEMKMDKSMAWSLLVGLSSAMGAAYFAEWTIAPEGVGRILRTALSSSRIPELYALIILGFAMVFPGQQLLSYLSYDPSERE
jgi:ABC-type nitrate/sulfonate/bicarbonate transport system permease component